MGEYTELYKRYKDICEDALKDSITDETLPQKNVIEAMKYSLLGGGKRLRGVLVLATAEMLGVKAEDAKHFAAAVEMVHAYSLIHDDLPCMDNDDLRRGKPTCHIAYGYATALLAGDGLLTKAFEEILKGESLSYMQKCNAAMALAKAAGAEEGMVGGQVIDIENENADIPKELLKTLHSLKTGALIRASVRLGCIAAGANEKIITVMDEYAKALGLMFQITDDILDVTSSAAELGKSVGSDIANGKTTYVTLYGIEGAKNISAGLAKSAEESLNFLKRDTQFLKEIAERMTDRTK